MTDQELDPATTTSDGDRPAIRPEVVSRLRGFVRRRPVVSVLLVFNTLGQAVALVPVVAYLGFGVQLDAEAILIIPTLLFLLGPALVVTRIAWGREGLRRLLRQMVAFRVRARWYVFAFLVLPGVTVAMHWAAPPGGWDLGALLRAYVLGFGGSLLFNFLTTNWWEETFWTGAVQAPLQQRFGPLRAVLITTPLFVLEHATLVLPGSVLGGGWSTLLTLLVIAPFVRAALGYVYNRTGSLAMVGLLHAASNAVGFGLMMRLYGVGGEGLLPLIAFGLVATIATRGRLGLTKAPDLEGRHSLHAAVTADPSEKSER